MPLIPDYTPTYIKQQINDSPKQVITAARWNELFNLLITQGDNNVQNVTDLLVALAASTAAQNLGADVPSVVSKTLQDVLLAYETRIANRYTKDEANALVGTNTNDLVKSIVFNDQDGKFTITKKDGSLTVIDTVLEKVPVSMVFETVGGVTRIKLTNQDGTTSFADVSSLVDNYTFSNTDTVSFTASGSGNQKTISAVVRDNSITLAKLNLEALSTIQGHVTVAANSATASSNSAAASAGSATTATTKATEAANSANAAANSASTATNQATAAATAASNADAAKVQAQTSRDAANTAASTASTAADNANTSKTQAESWAVGATGTRPGEDNNNAKYWAEQAAGTVTGVASFNGRQGFVTPQAGDYPPALIGAVPATRTVNSKALSANVVLTASDVSAVPTTRTINGKALSSDVVLAASDVGATVKTTYSTVVSATDWVGSSAPYTATKTVPGILSTDNPHAAVDYNATLATAMLEKAAYACVDELEATATNTLVFRCFEEKPTQTLNFILEVYR